MYSLLTRHKKGSQKKKKKKKSSQEERSHAVDLFITKYAV